MNSVNTQLADSSMYEELASYLSSSPVTGVKAKQNHNDQIYAYLLSKDKLDTVDKTNNKNNNNNINNNSSDLINNINSNVNQNVSNSKDIEQFTYNIKYGCNYIGSISITDINKNLRIDVRPIGMHRGYIGMFHTM